VNYAKLLEISSFFTWHIFLEVGKTQDIPSKIWQTLRDALTITEDVLVFTFHQGERAWLQCRNVSSILQLTITRLQQKQNKMSHRHELITLLENPGNMQVG